MLWMCAAWAADLPLEQLDYDVHVTGPLAHVRVHQRFHNPNPGAVNAIYRVPIDREASLDGLILRLSDSTMEGRVFETDRAREAYDAAAAAGQTAALTEFDRFDGIEQRVANIQPGETVEVELSLVQPIRRDGDAYTVDLPLLNAPRLAPEHDRMDAAPVWPKVRASVEVTVDAGVEIQWLDSPTHPVFARPDGHGWLASATDLPLDADFQLAWSPAQKQPEAGALVDGEHLLVVLEPEAMGLARPAPMELVVLYDGKPQPEANRYVRALLDSLGPEDQVRRVLEPLGPSLAAALGAPDSGRSRVVLVVSDGHFDTAPLYETLLRYEGSARVHTLASRPGSDRWVLDEVARLGGGTSHAAQTDSLEPFLASLGRPVLSGITVDWAGWNLKGITPTRIPDVHPGRPQHILAQVVEGGGPIRIEGTIGGLPWEVSVTPRTVSYGRGLASSWVRRRIGELGRIQVRTGAPAKPEGLALALQYGVVSPWTSLLAIDPRKRQQARQSASVKSKRVDRVETEEVVATANTSRSTVETKEFLTRVPSGRNYQSATQMAAGIAVDPNRYPLDGANGTDPVSGTFSVNFNFDAARIQPHTALFPFRESDLLEPNGSNNLKTHVGVAGAWGLESERPTHSLRLYGDVSGPLVRDKAFAWVGVEQVSTRGVAAGDAVDRETVTPALHGVLTLQPSAEHRVFFGARTTPNSWAERDVSPRGEGLLSRVDTEQGQVEGSTRWVFMPSPETQWTNSIHAGVETHAIRPDARRLGWSGARDLLPAVANWEHRQQSLGAASVLSSAIETGVVAHNLRVSVEARRKRWRNALSLAPMSVFGGQSTLPGATLLGGDPVDLSGGHSWARASGRNAMQWKSWTLDLGVGAVVARESARDVGAAGGVAAVGHAGLQFRSASERTELVLKASRRAAPEAIGVQSLATLTALDASVQHPDGRIESLQTTPQITRAGLPTQRTLELGLAQRIVSDFSVHAAGHLVVWDKTSVFSRDAVTTLRTDPAAKRTEGLLRLGVSKLLSRRWMAQAEYRLQGAWGTLYGPLEPTFSGDAASRRPGPLANGDIHQFDAHAVWNLPTDPFTLRLNPGIRAGSGGWVERLLPTGSGFNPYRARAGRRGAFARLPGWWMASIFLEQELDVRRGKLVLRAGVDGIGPKRSTQFSAQQIGVAGTQVEMARRAPTAVHGGLEYRF